MNNQNLVLLNLFFLSSLGQASFFMPQNDKLEHFKERWFKSFLLIFIHEHKQSGH